MSLWPFVGSVVAASTLAAAVAVPAARRYSMGTVEQDWLCHELDLDSIASDRATVRTKTGTLCRVLSIVGEPYETKPLEEQQGLLKGRSQLFDQLAGLGVSWRWFGVKRRRPLIHVNEWPSPVLKTIGAAEEAVFRESYSIHWYLMLSCSEFRTLETATARALALLKPYAAEVLSSPEQEASEAAQASCPLTGFLNFLVCGELRNDLPPLSSNLSQTLPAGDPQFQRSGVLTVALPTPIHHQVIVVRRWPELVTGQIIGDLMALHGEIDFTQVCLPERGDVASALLLRKSKEQSKNPFASSTARAETAAVLDLVSNGAGWLKTQFHITVRSADLGHLAELVRQVGERLSHYRVLYSVETEGLPVAWFNRQPDHNKLLRPLKMTAEAVSAVWALPFSPVGRSSSPWGSGPIRYFPTSTGQAYSFQFHLSPQEKSLGHYLVFAPSGSGKSTLLMHLLGGQTRHKIPAYICDSKEGTRFMVEAMGGRYQSYERLALNPLAMAENTTTHRQQLGVLIRSMMGDASLDPATDDILHHTLEMAFLLPPEKRTFNALFAACFPANSPQRQAMAKWVIDSKGRKGEFSHIFNSPQDGLAELLGDAPLVGINLNEALDDPLLGSPLVGHIITTIIRTQSGGRGFNIFIDEAGKLLQNDAFRKEVEVMYREYRKVPGIVGLAFQEPNTLFESGIGSKVLQNTATMIFFPNMNAKAASEGREAYNALGLNDEQKNFIFNAPADGGRRVLVVKRDPALGFEESVILNIDLAPLPDCLKFYRAGDAIKDLYRAQAEWGAAWHEHL